MDDTEKWGQVLKTQSQPVFGRPNKPRHAEPPISELLSWPKDDTRIWDLKKQNKEVLMYETTDYEMFQTKIHKSETPWISETQDNYRNYFGTDKPRKRRAYPSPSKDEQARDRENHPNLYSGLGNVPAFYTTKAGNAPDLKLNTAFQPQNPMASGPSATERVKFSDSGAAGGQKLSGHNGNLGEGTGSQTGINGGYGFIKGGLSGNNHGEGDDEDMVARLRKVRVDDREIEEFRYSSARRPKSSNVNESINTKRKDYQKKTKNTSRWLADSHTQTYLGRPAFENYGRANVNPTAGGIVYGQYMHSHNVNPQRKENKPEYRQIYKNTQRIGGWTAPKTPAIPRETVKGKEMTEEELKAFQKRNPLTSERVEYPEEEPPAAVKKGYIKPVQAVHFESKQPLAKKADNFSTNEWGHSTASTKALGATIHRPERQQPLKRGLSGDGFRRDRIDMTH